MDEIDIQRRPGEWRDAYDRWQKSMPAEWDNLLFLFSYSESGDGGFESMIVDFKNSVSQGPENSVPSGRALFEKALAEEGFELLLLAERERMIATIEEFLADHPNEFSQALSIMLEQGSTAQEFAGGAVRVQHNLDVFTELLDELHNQILNGRHGVKSP
ncbi:MAG: hypothetical protein O7A03_12890 [Alphaproteobacteria bacterium]|nr:hypothetical protein [Alphaproteobacteria bacterium]